MEQLPALSLPGGPAVSRLGFGAGRITGEGTWGEPPDREEALRVLRRAVELGVTLIDTAESYGPHVSENLIAEALYPYPEELVIVTKAGVGRDPADDWRPDGRPEVLRAACEGSLKRLRVDQIDLYLLHWPDPKVPFEESVGALAGLREEGKVLHAGLSNVSVEQLELARAIVPIVCVQGPYNLVDREADDVLAVCERDRLGFLAYFPLGYGSLTRAHATIDLVARASHATCAQVALAWLLQRSSVLVPIPGTRHVHRLEENIASTAVQLSADQIALLDGMC